VHPALGNALLPPLLADARFLVAFRRIHELGVGRIPVAEEKRIELPANSLAVDQQPDVTAALEVVPLPVAGAEPAMLAVHHQVLGMSHPGERNEPDGGRWNGQQPDDELRRSLQSLQVLDQLSASAPVRDEQLNTDAAGCGAP